MKRLIAAIEITDILDKVNNQLDIIKEDYIVLLNQLNSLYKNYEDIYTQISQVVKLPTSKDMENLINMISDFNDISNHFNNDNYVEEYTNKVNDNLENRNDDNLPQEGDYDDEEDN